jgi:hypothetical protein
MVAVKAEKRSESQRTPRTGDSDKMNPMPSMTRKEKEYVTFLGQLERQQQIQSLDAAMCRGFCH